MSSKPRIAVVSPFLDKRHGTERCICEQIQRLSKNYEIHVYSQRVEDLDRNQIVWHRIADIPGPHLFKYLWWFLANQAKRRYDSRFRKLSYDAIYTPGVNCFDADLISVHIVFAEFHRRVRGELLLRRNPARMWPLLIHRRLYYRLMIFLEGRIYRRKGVVLDAVSRKIADDLRRFYVSGADIPVTYHGIDPAVFNPEIANRLRELSRREFALAGDAFTLLLVGNDWKKKGLRTLLEAVGALQDSKLWIIVVGHDDRTPYVPLIKRLNLENRTLFLPMRPDVNFYYAASDCYVGPSLEDAYAMPPLEAMACGLPVIVSRQAGVSEIITHGEDGFILEDPADSQQLSKSIQRLYDDNELRRRISERAIHTAQSYTWDQNAKDIQIMIEKILRLKEARK